MNKVPLKTRSTQRVRRKFASEHLADLLSAIYLESVPQTAVSAAKNLIVDSFGCMLGGSTLSQGQIMTDFIADMAGVGKSTVAGYKKPMVSAQAAYLNAYMANLLDFDDTYFGHPGATIIPPSLALAEEFELSGCQFLEAVIAGYEVGLRVADAIKPSRPRLRKVMGLSTWQTLCAGAAATKALNLCNDDAVHALSLASLNAPVPVRKLGLSEGRAHWLKNNYGWAVMGGMIAAMLARKGFIGDPCRSGTALRI